MLSGSFIAICVSIVMPKRDQSHKMENYPIGFAGYIVGFIMGHLLNKFESKELRVYKQRIKQLEEEQKHATKIEEEKKKDAQRFVEVLKNDNAMLRKQLAKKNNAIQRLEDYLSHILAYASEIRQRTTLQQRTIMAYEVDPNFFDVYQDILEALSDIRYGTSSGKTLKRRDSRKSLTDKSSYKKMYYEEKCSRERLNSQMEQTQSELARAKKQTENLKQEKVNLQKRALQDTSLNDIRSYDNFERLAEQYKTFLASYYFLETQYINLKNEHDIAVHCNQDLKIVLQAKNSYIQNIQKVLTSFLPLRYLFRDVDSTYDHSNFVLHIAEQEDSTERSKYFQNFVDNIKKGVAQAKEVNGQEDDSNSLALKVTALQNKNENLRCLKEDAESKCVALGQALQAKELRETNLLEEYNKVCVRHTNIAAEVKQKTRELENINKDFQAFKTQAQENEEDLKKGRDQIKQSYHTIQEENAFLKSENEVAQNHLQDLLVEREDLLDKYNCLEEELICVQNQLNQYKNPDLMPSYQEVLKLYTEVQKIVEEAEQREKECAERNSALAERINKLTAENRQLKSKPIFEKISSLYEAICFVQNQQSLQKNEYTKTKEFYRKEINRLNLENVKLLTALKNEQNGLEHREFKSRFEAMKTEIKGLQESFEDLKFDQITFQFEENLSKIVAETFEIIRKISPDNSQLTQKYEVLIEMLRQEHERLNDKTEDLEEASGHRLPVRQENERKAEESEENSYVDSYMSSTLKRIENIWRDIGELEARVDRFRGSRNDKEYLDLDHKLLESIMRIDVIQVEGHEVIRQKRKEAIIYASNCMQKLEDNVTE